MQGVTKYAPGPGNVALRDAPEPMPGPNQVKIAVQAAGICGTDIHIHDAEYPSNPPVILGHEMAGVIAAVGSGVTDFSVGDRVTALPYAVTCGTCAYCLQGAFPLCPSKKSFGSGVNGAFAPYLVIPAAMARRLPDNLDFDSGAMTEPVACCTTAILEKSAIRLGDVVLVIGPGTIGLIAMQMAKGQGAKVILVGTPDDGARLSLGRELGADYVLQVGKDDIAGVVNETTNGMGVHFAVECAGVAPAVRMAIQFLRKQGQLTQMGLSGKTLEVDYDQVVYKDLRIVGSFASSASSWDKTLILLRDGLVRVQPLIGQALPLREWERGFAAHRSKGSLKVLLHPTEG